jgi:hypothetical protein
VFRTAAAENNNNLMALKGSVESQELCADPASAVTVSPVRRPPCGFWASRMWSAYPVTVAVGSSVAIPSFESVGEALATTNPRSGRGLRPLVVVEPSVVSCSVDTPVSPVQADAPV